MRQFLKSIPKKPTSQPLPGGKVIEAEATDQGKQKGGEKGKGSRIKQTLLRALKALLGPLQ